MQTLSAIQDPQYVLNIYQEILGQEIMTEVTKHTVCIKDERMKKQNYIMNHSEYTLPTSQ